MKPSTPPLGTHRPATACRHCGQPLDALAQRRGLAHCGSAACRQSADAAVLNARWQQVAALAVAQAQALQKKTRRRSPPALVWLRPAERELEPVSPALREALRASWRRRAEEGWCHNFPGRDSATALPAGAGVLCAQCGGHCCAQGGTLDAFIDAEVLQRWQQEHPGSSLDDAIDDYLAQLPALHIKNGCGFQGATGCVLPRERRAPVCNRYACNPLLELAKVLQDEPARAAVVLTADGRQLQRAALLQQGRYTPLEGLPHPDDLPPPP